MTERLAMYEAFNDDDGIWSIIVRGKGGLGVGWGAKKDMAGNVVYVMK